MVADNRQEYIKINFSRKDRETRALLRVVNFRDGDHEIAYVPSLNLSGYGSTAKEAEDMLLNIVVNDYFLSLIHLPEAQVFEELRQYGWVRRPLLHKQLRNTQFLSVDKIKEDFNLPAETQFHEHFVAA